MVFEAIDHQKRELTDKFVIVIGKQPELARFEGFVGQVKTVNMSGRALVEFTGLNNNVGWFDIDPHFLKVVDKPSGDTGKAGAIKKPASKIPGKGAPKSAADILALARSGGVKSKPDAAGRQPKKVSPASGRSTADILAAARGKGADTAQDTPGTSSPEGKKESPALKLSTADVLAAVRGKAPAKPPTARREGLSTAEILAAARNKGNTVPPKGAAAPAADSHAPATNERSEPRHLTAADILAIASGKQSLRRIAPVHTEPLVNKPLSDAGAARPAAIPAPIDRSKLTAEAIRNLGLPHP
ncbi:hypothetical protein [Botrimarina hoheduenensis]|uniref:Uncharacterized protein n=1 Tax=Botrimarina hoheduenensis TaxID=2528000 RepID=A0A5C5W973_9BACT|nr:hypothetical protein [Botrimarina hoheduenensis]TWT47426.1 hypothetical protein Pla111_10400 [Botrimarina hoheduenensis]